MAGELSALGIILFGDLLPSCEHPLSFQQQQNLQKINQQRNLYWY
jgi:hypothetical protein